LYNTTRKTAISKIDLKTLIEYFEGNICNHQYTYTLEDGRSIVLDFKVDQLPHLLGLHYIKPSLKGQDAINEIKGGRFDLKNARKSHKEAFKMYIKERIEYFPCLEEILNNTSFIEYNPLKTRPFSKIEANYMLYSEKINTWVLLGIKEVEKDFIRCVPVTFVVDRERKFVNNQEMKKVIKFKKELIF